MNADTQRLTDLPLWRLLVALHDAELCAGPDSVSVEILRKAVDAKLKRIRQLDPDRNEGVAHA